MQGGKMIVCKICGRCFDNPTGISAHYRQSHPNDSRVSKIVGYRRDVLVGTLLGDSSITMKRNKCRVRFNHSIRQEEYCKFKSDVLGDLVISPNYTYIDSRGFSSICCYTTYTRELNDIHDLFILDGKKSISCKVIDELNDVSLAFWYMDDGCLKTRIRKNSKTGVVDRFPSYIKITTPKLEDEVLEKIKCVFKDRFDISVRIENQVSCVTGDVCANIIAIHGKENMKKFKKLIFKHVIPSMLYKLPSEEWLNNRGGKPARSGPTPWEE